MNALNRKLLRELWKTKGQMLSIALVVATGVMVVVTMRGSYESLVQAQQVYYRTTRFPDVWASLKRAPEALRHRIEEIPGVVAVDTRVSFPATLDIPELDSPAQGHFFSLPADGRPLLSELRIRSGRTLSAGHADEVLVSENFAEARHLAPGDSLRTILNGRARTLKIVGVAISPEHTYVVPPGSLLPDDARYGVMWVSRETAEAAYQMEGAFNEVVLTISPTANEDAVIHRLDALLSRYGGLGAYGRDAQVSHQILKGELDQNRVMGTAIPAVFLAVAAFLLNLVLGRLISTQRGEIAVLKAFGYRDREVGLHYLMFAMVAVVGGIVVGTVGGILLGHQYIAIYAMYFDFPVLEYHLSGRLLAMACVVSLVAAVSGALSAVRRAVTLPPAEAMRPEAPPTFRPGWGERMGLGSALSPGGRMLLRNLERRPVRNFISSLGVACSVAILVLGMFMLDGIQFLVNLQFREIQREDLAVSFLQGRSESVRFDLAWLDGVTVVEPYRSAPVRLHSGHREREVAVQGMLPQGRLRRLVSVRGTVQPPPEEGLLLSELLARQLHVAPGDIVDVEFLDGERSVVKAPVAGVLDDLLGMGAFTSLENLHRLAGGERVFSGAYLRVAERERSRLNTALKRMPGIAGVSLRAAALDAFEEQLGKSLLVSVFFLLSFAGVIAVGVIYNGARIALSERGRELASLRVMGFRRSEVARVLLGEQAVVTVLAVPMGWAIGYGLSKAVAAAIESESYRVPFVADPRTYVFVASFTLVVAACSGWIVRRRIDRLDLIAVLKTGE